MKADILDTNATKVGQIDLPEQFKEKIREDIIKRAFLSVMGAQRISYGAYKEAGQRQVTKLSRRRRDFKGSYGKGISRVPRKSLWVRGGQFGWVGARAPGTVSGRRAHPPKSSKIYDLKVNLKERRLAIRSAISATINKEILSNKNYLFTPVFPLIIDQAIENINKTKDLESLFAKLGLKDVLEERAQKRQIRAGRGKSRSRKYRSKVGPLIVVSKKSQLFKAAKNIPGVDIACVDSLNMKILAPGATPGRYVIWSKGAIERLTKEKLYSKK